VEIVHCDLSDFGTVNEALRGITGAHFIYSIQVSGILAATAFFAQTARSRFTVSSKIPLLRSDIIPRVIEQMSCVVRRTATATLKECHEHHHYQRRHGNLLQGLGEGSASGVQPCVFAELGLFGRSNVLPGQPRLSLRGSRSSGPDQIAPVGNAYRTSKLIPNATLKVYPGAPHAMTTTAKNQVNEDLLAFIKN
jgi:pimeloyl-ACP methyl ester carboxylesterase